MNVLSGLWIGGYPQPWIESSASWKTWRGKLPLCSNLQTSFLLLHKQDSVTPTYMALALCRYYQSSGADLKFVEDLPSFCTDMISYKGLEHPCEVLEPITHQQGGTTSESNVVMANPNAVSSVFQVRRLHGPASCCDSLPFLRPEAQA